jgi:IS1 family transposase
MRRSCTNAPSAISTSHTSSWRNDEHGSAAIRRCSGSGWPSTPLEKYSCPPCGSPHAHLRVYGHSLFATDPGSLSASPFSPVTVSICPSLRLSAHVGHWLEVSRRGRKVFQWQVAAELSSGQVKKTSQRRKLVRVTPVMRLGTSAVLTAAFQGLGLTGRLNTAFIERLNLTVRHGAAALARRTWATSQQASQLLAHLQWWRASAHCVRPHALLRVALMQPRERGGRLLAQRSLQRREAVAVGRTTRRWTSREVLSGPLPPVSA